jgi:hypothetical protein
MYVWERRIRIYASADRNKKCYITPVNFVIWLLVCACMYVCMYVCVRDADRNSKRLHNHGRFCQLAAGLCMFLCMYVCMYVFMYVCMYASVDRNNKDYTTPVIFKDWNVSARMHVCIYICM